jgi:hypothetical protein
MVYKNSNGTYRIIIHYYVRMDLEYYIYVHVVSERKLPFSENDSEELLFIYYVFADTTTTIYYTFHTSYKPCNM